MARPLEAKARGDLAAFVFQAADAALSRFTPMDKCHDSPERANTLVRKP